MLTQLTENVGMTFIWAEISYFSKWYDQISPEQQRAVKSYVPLHPLYLNCFIVIQIIVLQNPQAWAA